MARCILGMCTAHGEDSTRTYTCARTLCTHCMVWESTRSLTCVIKGEYPAIAEVWGFTRVKAKHVEHQERDLRQKNDTSSTDLVQSK